MYTGNKNVKNVLRTYYGQLVYIASSHENYDFKLNAIRYLVFIYGVLTRMTAAGNEYFRDTILTIHRLAKITILVVRRLNISNTKTHDWTRS
jgi:hypothetical protein